MASKTAPQSGSSSLTPSQITQVPTNARPRLIITKLRMENFKSYCGVQEIGPFHKSFTAVIGPNGSGKSNVIDAMLFVFGRRANQIRLKKLSELIHNSSQATDLPFCSVEVHFAYILDDANDKDAYTVVEGTQFFVKRLVARNNQSQYYINNKSVTVQEVVEKLKNDCQIDLDHNRFLILQGEVEQIAMMKPKAPAGSSEVGLLEYLEDIIGTSQLKPEIDKQHAITEDLTHLRQEKLQNQEKAKREFTDAQQLVDQRVHFGETVYKFANLSYLNNFLKVHRYTTRYRDFCQYLIDTVTTIGNCEIELKKLQKKKSKLESGNKKDLQLLDTKTKAIMKLDERFTQLDAQHSALDKKKILISNNRAAVLQRIEQQKAQLDSLLRHHKDEQTRLPKVDEDISKKETELTSLEQLLEEKVETVSQITEPLKLKLQEINLKFEPLTKAYTEAQQILQRCEMDHAAVQRNFQNSVQKKSDVTKDIEVTLDAIARCKTDFIQKQDKTRELIELRGETQHKVKMVVVDLKEAEQRLQKINQHISSIQTQIAALQDNNNMDDEYSMQNGPSGPAAGSSLNLQKLLPYQRLLEQKYAYSNLKFKDVYGRIADICYIDPRYETALSNACGDSQNVVVLNSSTAQICLGYFREYSIGRATFIPLDAAVIKAQRQRLHDAQSRLHIPQDSQRLFDLIKWPEHVPPDLLELFKLTLYKSIGETLVCDDVDSASRIAYADKNIPRRTVALSGEIMGASGTMSGGRVKRGLFATSLKDCHERMEPSAFTNKAQNVQNVQQQKKKQDDDRKKDEEHRVELERLSGQLGALQQQRGQAEYDLVQKNRSKSEAFDQLQLVGSRIQTSEREVKEIQLDISNEEETLITHQNQLQHISTMESRQTQDKKELNEKSAAVISAQKRVEALSLENEQANSERNGILQQILTKGGSQVSSMKKEVQSLRAKIDELGVLKREIERNIAGHQVKYDQRKAQLDVSQLEIDGIDAQLVDIEQEDEKILLEAEEVIEKKDQFGEEVRLLDEKVRSVKLLTIQFDRDMHELSNKKNTADSEYDQCTAALKEAEEKIKLSLKTMKKAISSAGSDLEALIEAEMPPNPFNIALGVHKSRRVDFIARFIKNKQDEKKRLEQEELEAGRTGGKRRKKAATVISTAANDSDDDSDGDDDATSGKLELKQWEDEAQELFIESYPVPVDGDEFTLQYKKAVEECKTAIYQRLPWYAPTVDQIARFSTKNFFLHADDPQYHQRLEDLTLPPFVRFEYSVHQLKRSDLSPEQLIEQIKRDEALKQEHGSVAAAKIEVKNETMNDNDDAAATEAPKRGRKGARGKKALADDEQASLEIDPNNTAVPNPGTQPIAVDAVDAQEDPELDFVLDLKHNLDDIIVPQAIQRDHSSAFVKQAESEEKSMLEVVHSIGDVAADAVKDYQDRQLKVAVLIQYLEIITQQREDEKKKYEELRAERTRIFMAGLHEISNQLKTLYRMLTLGGDAELELSDQNDPFLDGITFSVRPPKKSWKQIQNLSGGEKTLSSLSLVFALHYFKPTPLYVMDEIDAALDYKNVSIVANYIRERTNNNAQFIIISLRNNMFELSNRLVGIYKTNDRTKTITIDPREYIKSILLQQQAQQQQQQLQQQQQQQYQQQLPQNQSGQRLITNSTPPNQSIQRISNTHDDIDGDDDLTGDVLNSQA